MSSLLGANEETACAFLLDFGFWIEVEDRLDSGTFAPHGFSLPRPHEVVTHPAQEAEAVI
jgi:hypothetical protein